MERYAEKNGGVATEENCSASLSVGKTLKLLWIEEGTISFEDSFEQELENITD